MFSKIVHILDHETSPIKFRGYKIYQASFPTTVYATITQMHEEKMKQTQTCEDQTTY